MGCLSGWQSGFYVSSLFAWVLSHDKMAAPAPHISPGHCPFAPEALLWPLWASLARPEPEGWSAFLEKDQEGTRVILQLICYSRFVHWFFSYSSGTDGLKLSYGS